MDKFKETLLLEEIKKETRKSALKKIISNWHSKSDHYYNLNNTEIIFNNKVTLDNLSYRIKAFRLFTVAVERYKELFGDTQDLPLYSQRKYITVGVMMSLEEAYDYIKDNCND